jgi:inner membrane protein
VWSDSGMDPLTHALAGAAAARVVTGRSLGPAALVPGAVGALLPDVDALIRSSADPLLYAEFHRHFTHSLAFVPVGGLVASLPWLVHRATRGRRRAYLAAATVGYATHGVLDASTTYGTLLLWPFSMTRVSWDAVAIVDPVVTLVLLVGLTLAHWRRRAAPAATALLVCGAYLAIGAAARERAMEAQQEIASARGHTIVRGAVFPGFASNVLWRSLYLAGDTLYMDRIRVPWSGSPTWKPGTTVPLFRFSDLAPQVRTDPRLARDFWRFNWFTDGWMTSTPGDATLIADARYSESSDRFEPVWGIRLAVPGPVPVAWIDRSGQRRIDPGQLWDEIRGADPGYRALK